MIARRCFSVIVLLGAGSMSAPRGRGEVIRFPATDGVEIIADYYAPTSRAEAHAGKDAPAARRAPAAILLHMYRSDRSSWTPLIDPLIRAGFAVLAIDLRGHGDSGGAQRDALIERALRQDPAIYRDMWQDVDGAYAWLATRPEVDPTRLAIVGASVGSSVAFDYSVRDRSVDVVVALTPGTGYFGMDATSTVMQLSNRKMLLLAVEGDRRAVDVLSRVNPNAVKEIVGRHTGHGTRMFGTVAGVEGRIVSFLVDGVGGPSSSPVVSVLGSDLYYSSPVALTAAEGAVPPGRRRWYSSREEAERRGCKPSHRGRTPIP